jgi:hypothetical protein
MLTEQVACHAGPVYQKDSRHPRFFTSGRQKYVKDTGKIIYLNIATKVCRSMDGFFAGGLTV